MTGRGESELADALRRVRERDPEARARLFSLLGDDREAGAVVLALARRVLPRGHWARRMIESRDIVQSALRTAWTSLSAFRGESEGELYAWLRTILRTKVHRTTRREGARRERCGEEVYEEGGDLAGEGLPVDLPSIRDEDVLALRGAVAALPQCQRTVLELRLEGLSTPEIGRILGLSEVAVRKRESRAVKELRARFDERDAGGDRRPLPWGP
ncbi:MAG: sigma-70 family RNA polymerase sigma factor [Planctomycetes bacterium]|nr:sigma-70 family RNA polymerase sigma factor [Planctomycetota bacterium]